MAVEAYDPCPCGSDKKFKFCCQPISDDLAAMERLADDHQPKQVLLAIEKLEPEHASNLVLLRCKFRACMELGQIEAARSVVEYYTSTHPDDAIAKYFDIKWNLFFRGWEGARPLLERDLMIIRSKFPPLARELAIDAFEVLMQAGLYMAARRYLLDGLMWSPTQEVFDKTLDVLRRINAATDIPFPCRCTYGLQPLPDHQPNQQEFAEAFRIADSRNYFHAAQLFEALAEKDQHQPVLSLNAGLCYAWAGDLVASSELLGQAADDLPDFESAVNWETLAQLLELELPDQQVPLRAFRYRVTSVSRLLTQLNQSQRLVRQEIPEQLQERSKRITGLYMVLNQDLPTPGMASLKDLPRVVANIVVLDEDQENSAPAEVQINARSPQFSDADLNFLVQLCDGLLDQSPAENWGELPSSNSVSKDRAALNFDAVFGQGLRQSEILKTRHDFAAHICYEVWPQTPLSSLDGISPQKAARNPDAHLPVCGAINVLATFGESVGFDVDVDLLRKQLGLPAVQPSPVSAAKDIVSIPATEAARLPFELLEPAALVNAFSIIGATNQTYAMRRCLKVMFERKIYPPDFSLNQFCHIAHGLAFKVLDFDDASFWIEQGKAAIPDEKEKLHWQIQWSLDEIVLAAITGKIEQLTQLLRNFARNYFERLPNLKEQIWSILEGERIDDRQIMSIMNGTDVSLVGAIAGETTPGGLWTPDGPTESTGGGKLWVPGQS